jgi:Domain of unknown function (DUF4105)
LRLLRFLSSAAFAVIALAFGLWGALALFYRAPFPPPFPLVIAALWAALALGALIGFFAGRRRLAAAVLIVAVALILGWWSTLRPRAERDWAADVARTVRGEVSGDILTLTDVRNFDWRTEEDFTPRWETRTYDLSKLVSVDLIANYWAGEAIAHTIVSFGFSDGRHLAWSIELRRVRGQEFSAIAGFFRESELVMIAADERDVFLLRTVARNEDLRLFRLRADPEIARRALLTYVEEANELAEHPRWYNTLTTNCTTAVVQIARVVQPGTFPLDWRVLVSGHLPDYAYDLGALDRSLPFPELREKAKFSTRAKAAKAASSEEFSRAIRAGVPGIPQ